MAEFDYSRFMQENNNLLCAPQFRCQISYDQARGPAIKSITGAVVALSVIIMLFLFAFCGSWMYFRNKINLSKQQINQINEEKKANTNDQKGYIEAANASEDKKNTDIMA